MGLETVRPWFQPGFSACWLCNLGGITQALSGSTCVNALSLVLGAQLLSAQLTLAVNIINPILIILSAFRDVSLGFKRVSESSDPTEHMAGGH